MPLIIVGGQVGDWGIVPSFLDEEDPRSATEQFAEKYIGWSPFEGHTLVDINTMELSYPDDPPMRPISVMLFRRERLYLYPFEWVLVLQPDKTWVIARMD